ncbi:MAG: hypothetical protein NC127_08725 [Muribaculum sp.]|nr:hypothetical protein [Muribaculum sp.]
MMYNITCQDIIRVGSRLALGLAVALGVSGCSVIYEEFDEPSTTAGPLVPVGRSICVQFRVDSRSSSSSFYSRAESWTDPDDTHTEEEPSDFFESAIDFSDGGGFRFMIFDNGGNQDSKLVFDSSQLDYEGLEFAYNVSGSADNGYIVNASIPMVEGVFEKHPDGGTTNLRIVVFANTNGATPMPSLTLYSSTWADMPTGRYSYDNPTFVLSQNWYPDGVDNFIPLYGWDDYSVSNNLLYESEIYAPVIIQNPVYLLRSVAKIELKDGIVERNDAGYPKVKSVETYSSGYDAFALNGCLIPSGFAPMTQVTFPTMPSSTARGTVEIKPLTGNEADGATYNYWRLYCPEQVFAVRSGTGSMRTVPSLKVTIQLSGSATDTKTYQIGMDGSVDKDNRQFPGVINIMRNHIYRIVINSVSVTNNIVLQHTIDKWDSYVTTIPPFE